MPKKLKPAQGKLLPFYWLNGKLKNHNEHGVPTIPTLSQAMDYSVVIIDGLRVNIDKKGRAYGFRFQDHVQRMLDGWKELQLTCPYTHAQILAGLKECVAKNLDYLAQKNEKLENLYIRPKIYHSDAILKPFYGHSTNVVIECFPFGDYLPASGISATVADHVRTYRYSGYATKGAGKYPEYGRVRDHQKGLYDDVLQLGLGKGGKLIFTEGTSSNLFFVAGGKMYTPGVDDFILKGVTRDSVIKLAKYLKIKVVEGEVPLSLVLESEEIFLTGTASFIAPIIKIGKHKLGIGPVTKKLSELFSQVRTGEIKQFEKWLTKF